MDHQGIGIETAHVTRNSDFTCVNIETGFPLSQLQSMTSSCI